MFVEGLRLLLVVAGVIAGLAIGNSIGRSTTAPVVGITLGALIAYVIGGVLGRTLRTAVRQAVLRLSQMPANEVFAGSMVGTTGLLVGLVAGLPLIALVHSSISFPVVAALAWVLCFFGVQLGVAKGREIVRVAGLTHLVEPQGDPPPDSAFVVDTSAVLDRQLLVLGRAGLLPGGIVVPVFVLDEVRALAGSPDPVASRRARRGLESLEALRHEGHDVQLVAKELPQLDSIAERTVLVAKELGLRVATCSSQIAQRASESGVGTLDLRSLPTQLTPEHTVGERVRIDLVKEGRQPRQAVGYLDDGDMVVVNDAAHLVGTHGVEVVVSGTRQTSQGALVFARLAEASA